MCLRAQPATSPVHTREGTTRATLATWHIWRVPEDWSDLSKNSHQATPSRDFEINVAIRYGRSVLKLDYLKKGSLEVNRHIHAVLRARLSVGHPTVVKVPYFGPFGDGADAASLSVWPGGKPDSWSRSFSEKYDRVTRHEGEVDCSGPWVILLNVGDSAHMIGSCRFAHRPHPQE